MDQVWLGGAAVVIEPLEPGGIWLLSTQTQDGGLRTRPVAAFPGAETSEVLVMTTHGARKLAEIAAFPGVTLSGPAPGGWWAGEGRAVVDSRADHVGEACAAAGLPHLPDAVLIRISITSGRRWTVHSADPWDNSVVEETYSQAD